MRVAATFCLLAGALAGASAPAAAQSRRPEPLLRELILTQYEAVNATVFQVRTTAELGVTGHDGRSGEEREPGYPIAVEGTGVVVGEIEVDGRREYLVLTNHHVADVSNYVISDGGYLRENKRNTRAVPNAPEESFLLWPGADDPSKDVRLIEVGRNVKGDMTVFRTVGVDRELPVFRGPIGYTAEESLSGASVITSGFPQSGGKITALGEILTVDRLHELGQPHVDFTVELPVERGQSGSPVFLVEPAESGEELGIRFRLVGLLHASEHGEKFMVPWALWGETLEENAGTAAERIVR